MKAIHVLLMILAASTQFFCGSPPTDITQQWDRLEKQLSQGVSVLDRFIEAKDPRFIDRLNVFKKDKGDLESDLNQILSEAVEILDVSELTELKAEINQQQRNIREVRENLSKLRFDAEMAAGNDRDKAARRIQDQEQKIAESEALIAEKKTALVRAPASASWVQPLSEVTLSALS